MSNLPVDQEGMDIEFVEFDDDTSQEYAQEAQAASSSGAWWKAREGNNTIRILPPLKKWGVTHPIFISREHFMSQEHLPIPGIEGKFGFQCPKETSGEFCPVCEFVDSYAGMVGRPLPENIRKELRTRVNYYANIVDYDHLEMGPVKARLPMTVEEGIRIVRDQVGDYSHPKQGYWISINRKGTGARDTEYTGIMMAMRLGICELDGWQDYLRAMTPLLDFARKLTPELSSKLQAGLHAVVGGGGGATPRQSLPAQRQQLNPAAPAQQQEPAKSKLRRFGGRRAQDVAEMEG